MYSNSELGFVFNTSTKDTFPIKKYVLGYAVRLVGKVELKNSFLELLLCLMPVKEKRELINYFIGLIKKPYWHDNAKTNNWMRDIRKELHENIYEDGNLASTIIRYIEDKDYAIRKNLFVKQLYGIMKRLYDYENDKSGKEHAARIAELRTLFDLDEADTELLCFLHCMYGINVKKLNNLADDFSYNDFLRFTAIATDLPLARVRNSIGKRGRLYRNGFFENIDMKRNDFYNLDKTIVEYLCGASTTTIMDRFVKTDTKEPLPITNFGLPAQEIDIVISLLNAERPCNILLYGAAGTGKTEFARAAIRSAGYEPKALQFGDTDELFGNENENHNRILALRVGVNTADPGRDVLIVDEADFLLNSRYMFMSAMRTTEKGWLNLFLEQSRVKTIWITNETGFMEESTLRRFNYSVRFKEFTMAERERVFRHILGGNPLRKYISEDMIVSMCEEYRVNAGGIASSLDSLRSVFAGRKPDRTYVEKTLRGFLAKHEELIHGKEHGRDGALAKITDRYDAGLLHTDADMKRLETGLERFIESLKRSGEDDRSQMNLLFWGPPGTGKTEYAKYLSKKMKKRLLVKRYSDLESKWVGETEQNIAGAFREAEKSDAILFIDEADSFFTCRDTAYRSWEVSRTNEFLTQIENHRGILICCTNLLPHMDKAAMRRFNWKIEFKTLRPADRLPLYLKYFTAKRELLGAELQNRVMGIEGLSPGDLRTVWNRNRFIDEDEFDHANTIEELEREVGYRWNEKAKVGF